MNHLRPGSIVLNLQLFFSNLIIILIVFSRKVFLLLHNLPAC